MWEMSINYAYFMSKIKTIKAILATYWQNNIIIYRVSLEKHVNIGNNPHDKKLFNNMLNKAKLRGLNY